MMGAVLGAAVPDPTWDEPPSSTGLGVAFRPHFPAAALTLSPYHCQILYLRAQSRQSSRSFTQDWS